MIQHGSIPSGHGVVFRKENMRSSSAASLALIVEPCVRIFTEDHVARAIENSIGGIGSALIQYLIDGVIGAFCGKGLL